MREKQKKAEEKKQKEEEENQVNHNSIYPGKKLQTCFFGVDDAHVVSAL